MGFLCYISYAPLSSMLCLDDLKPMERNGMKYNGIECNKKEWNKDSALLFGYFMMNKTNFTLHYLKSGWNETSLTFYSIFTFYFKSCV